MERIEQKFESENSARAAGAILKKSLSAVGSSKISIKADLGTLKICISDKSASKQKAAVFGAKRLGSMLLEIDKAIK